MAFKFDAEILVDLVKVHRNIWDPGYLPYHNRKLRTATWRKLTSLIDDKFDVKSEEEKRKATKFVIKTWSTIRCHFLKRKKLNMPTRGLEYFPQLEFLFTGGPPPPRGANKKTGKQKTAKNKETQLMEANLEEDEMYNDNEPLPHSSGPSETISFLDSIRPVVDAFTDDELHEFQTQVLKLIQNIQNKCSSRQKSNISNGVTTQPKKKRNA